MDLPLCGTVIRTQWGATSDIGPVRSSNQDSWLAQDPLFAVADGMGGNAEGELASTTALEVLSNALSPEALDAIDPNPAELVGAIRAAAEAVASLGEKEDPAAPGTTLCGTLTIDQDGPQWLTFNIGDSRTYRLMREDDGIHHAEMERLPGNEGNVSLEQVTTDHSEVQYLVDEGQITQLEALTHPRRNVITRALGTGNFWEPDFWVLPARAGDRLMLCSDGLSGELSHEYMARVLTSIRHPQDAADVLQHEALRSGGRDNITVIVADAIEAQD